MAKSTIAELEIQLTKAAAKLDRVTAKKMFGCHALWADGNVFALVWKNGRIGLKLPVEKSFESLMAINGSGPWKAGPMKMSHWVLVPESFHTDLALLKKWTGLAHLECGALQKKMAKK